MTAPPFMQVYIADYTADVQHLTCEQDGAYWRILRAMWRAGGSLPNDPVKLARICGLSVAKWAKISPDIMSLLIVQSDTLSQARLTKEIKNANEKSAKRSEAGKLGGQAKALKTKEPDVANATFLPKHSLELEPDSISDANASSVGLALTPPSPTRPDEVKIAFDEWNVMAERVGLPKAKKLEADRRRSIKRRLADGGLDAWRIALGAVEASPHCRGESPGSWRADLDFVCQPRSWRKLLEGSYGGTNLAIAPIQPTLADLSPEDQAIRAAKWADYLNKLENPEEADA